MKIGSKLRELREAQNMSLDDVARLCKTTRQTIYKYENGIVTNIPYDRILLLSKALNTTPAILLGFSINEEENKISLDCLELTDGEKVVLDLFRQIPKEQQPVVLAMIKAALGGK